MLFDELVTTVNEYTQAHLEVMNGMTGPARRKRRKRVWVCLRGEFHRAGCAFKSPPHLRVTEKRDGHQTTNRLVICH